MIFPTDRVSYMSPVDTKSTGLVTHAEGVGHGGHLPDLSSSTSTHAIAQHYVGLYELDSLIHVVVLSKVPEDDFCGWRRGLS
jgi:hypothetical protein